MGLFHQIGVVEDLAGRGGILQQDAEHLGAVEIAPMVTDDHSTRSRRGANHFDCLRVAFDETKKKPLLASRSISGISPWLRLPPCPRRVTRHSRFHPGEIGDHGLEIESASHDLARFRADGGTRCTRQGFLEHSAE